MGEIGGMKMEESGGVEKYEMVYENWDGGKTMLLAHTNLFFPFFLFFPRFYARCPKNSWLGARLYLAWKKFASFGLFFN
ncbi:hypothetical protein Hanom_Chr05g00429361 [Helianthus anomalus]